MLAHIRIDVEHRNRLYLLLTVNSSSFWFIVIWSNGQYLSPVSWSWRTECLWLKVPRSTSCPLNLTWFPSTSNVAKASASATAQSIPSPVSIIFARSSKILLTALWGLKFSGRVVIALPTFFKISGLTLQNRKCLVYKNSLRITELYVQYEFTQCYVCAKSVQETWNQPSKLKASPFFLAHSLCWPEILRWELKWLCCLSCQCLLLWPHQILEVSFDKCQWLKDDSL